jgi:four helix bundle protein
MGGSRINSAKELQVYQMTYALSMEIYQLTKSFPPEERFALTSQIRRSSRSVAMKLREAWAKHRDEAHFIPNLTDCDGENSETDTFSDFAKDCGYITPEAHQALTKKTAQSAECSEPCSSCQKSEFSNPDLRPHAHRL